MKSVKKSEFVEDFDSESEEEEIEDLNDEDCGSDSESDVSEVDEEESEGDSDEVDEETEDDDDLPEEQTAAEARDDKKRAVTAQRESISAAKRAEKAKTAKKLENKQQSKEKDNECMVQFEEKMLNYIDEGVGCGLEFLPEDSDIDEESHVSDEDLEESQSNNDEEMSSENVELSDEVQDEVVPLLVERPLKIKAMKASIKSLLKDQEKESIENANKWINLKLNNWKRVPRHSTEAKLKLKELKKMRKRNKF